MEKRVGISIDKSARHPVGGGRGAPRFVLAEPPDSHVGAKLAGLGWHPSIAATDLAGLDAQALTTADVLVVVCAERTLLTPVFQAEAERVGRRVPKVAVIAGAGPEAAAYAARLGWHGFVPADASGSTIARAMVAVSHGELSFPASATQALVRALAQVAPLDDYSAAALTPRQRQIVTLIAQGATDAEIASLLHISRSTAHKHVQNARRRLHAKTRSQLVAASRNLAPSPVDTAVALKARPA
ncbi:MAG TPA: LuxR C-terminal-related transcriptional regulator [Candidatus Limnocylindria bacterium]